MFSILGSLRMVPEMIYVLKNFGFDYSICKESYVTDSPISGYWTFAFAMSKVPELGKFENDAIKLYNLFK